MKVTKIFLTVYGEKKFLEKKAAEGYELVKRVGFSYIFEKTGKDVHYGYVFLKKGRKSFIALDYKKKDGDAKAVYGNGYVALFKKYNEKPSVLPYEQRKVNYLEYRQKRMTGSLCLIMGGCCASVLARRIFAPLYILAALCLLLSFVYIYDTKTVDKLIKEM